jgi:hypothetical protein
MPDSVMQIVRKTGQMPTNAGAATNEGDDSPPAFFFVLNPLDFEGGLPIDFGNHCTVRRAASWEMIYIRTMLQSVHNPYFEPKTSYEAESVENRLPDGSVSHSFVPIAESKWRYTVVSVDGTERQRFLDLEWCCNLLSPAFEIGFMAMPHQLKGKGWGHLYGHNPAKLFSYWDSGVRFTEKPQVMPRSEIVALGEYWEAAGRLAPESFVKKALHSLDEIRLLPDASEPTVLALFGIIESLTTHIPEPKDTLDSIRRQLRNKMKLLRKRFARPIEAAAYFDSSLAGDSEKLWNKLYDYRSKLAHGATPDFSRDFKGLKQRRNVALFLKEIVRLLVIVGLKEEDFLSDLRDC